MSWYEKHGPDQDVVISTRVRLARNIKGHLCPHLLDKTKTNQVIQEIVDGVEKIDPKSFRLVELESLNLTDKQTLAERHLISPQIINAKNNKALLINEEEDLSVLILDEDHLRIQAISAGFEPLETFDRANKLAVALESVLDIAYDQEFGYLTACPTNVGTGLRVSALLHVPGLEHSRQLKYIIESLRRSGFTVRGYYGEGSAEQGQMIQVSNQITLGETDQDLVNKFIRMLSVFIKQERQAREKWYSEDPIRLKDRIFRAKAILSEACLIGSEEAFNCLSYLRLGRALGFDDFPDYPEILTLIYLIGRGSIQKRSGKTLAGEKRDEARANLIKKHFVEINNSRRNHYDD